MNHSCPFCDYAGPSDIIYSDDTLYIIEPLYPVTTGHRLVIPHRHVNDFTTDPDLTGNVTSRALAYADENFEASNIIVSRGKAATQTINHLHIHVIPRRPGDGLALPWATPQ